MINTQLSAGRGKPSTFLTTGFSTKAEIPLAFNSDSLHTMFKHTQKSWLWHQMASALWGFKQAKLNLPVGQFLDHGNSSSVEKVVGKGWLAWVKILAKDHLGNLPVQIVVLWYWGINIYWQYLVYHYRKSQFMFMFACGSKPDKNVWKKLLWRHQHRIPCQVLSCSQCTTLTQRTQLTSFATSCQFICLVTNLISNLSC